MNSKLLSRLGKYTGVGVIGYIAGSFVEKWKLNDVSQKDSLPHWPGLPVFGTVSAATPVVSETRVAIPGGDVTYSKPNRIAQVSWITIHGSNIVCTKRILMPVLVCKFFMLCIFFACYAYCRNVIKCINLITLIYTGH